MWRGVLRWPDRAPITPLNCAHLGESLPVHDGPMAMPSGGNGLPVANPREAARRLWEEFRRGIVANLRLRRSS
jgi:hypothetical protein